MLASLAIQAPVWASGPEMVVEQALPAERSAASRAMERHAEGDEAAFAEVYDALASRLLRYLGRLDRDPATAEDLVQQTFIRMHRARGSFRPGAHVEPWAFAIARRLFLDCRRQKKRGVLSWLMPEPSPEVDAEAILMARQLSDAARARLESLPPLQREAFLLIREDGLSMAEAAATLGVTVAAVKLRAQRAYDALRETMNSQAGETEGEA
jgi:RNA polymerase sigma-70 factor (ECF subfamily)